MFFMSMTRREVIELATDTGSSLGRLSVDGKPTGSAGEEEAPISLFARWMEVQSAARRVVERDEVASAAGDGDQVLEILALRAKGLTLRQVAERVSVSHTTVRARCSSTAAIAGSRRGQARLTPKRTWWNWLPACAESKRQISW